MTIIVSVKINDGIVMAADSAATFMTQPFQQMYVHSNKIVNLRKGSPIGVMWTGSGSFGSESLETLMKDLRQRFAVNNEGHLSWSINPESYTVEQVTEAVYKFLVEEKLPLLSEAVTTKLRICGYSSGRSLAEIWDVDVRPSGSDFKIVMDEKSFGPRWEGEYETLNRLIIGVSNGFRPALEEIGLDEGKIEAARQALFRRSVAGVHINAMSIQDAINLARFLVQTTVGFNQFQVGVAKTVGGEVEIAAITKHEGFRWVQRKHFYPPSLNG
jgi:hypothetical protein